MKRKKLNSEEKLFLTKISGYSVLVGTAMLLVPSGAKGDIVYVDPADITIDKNNKSFLLDLNNDTNIDFSFSFSSSINTNSSTSSTGPEGTSYTYYMNFYSYLYMDPHSSNSVLQTNGSYLAKLVKSYSITYSLANWNTNRALLGSISGSYTSVSTAEGGTSAYGTNSEKFGFWKSDANNKYIGVLFEIGNDFHCGWIRASVHLEKGNSSIVIHDWAYENEAETSIVTGQTEAPTPIELVDINLTETKQGIRLEWTTASETENSGFVVQKRTVDGTWMNLADYHDIPTLEGKGTTSESNHYSWLDRDVKPGKFYEYRIGDVDHKNKITWHDAISVTVSEDFALIPEHFGLTHCYPNPFNPALTIRYGLTDDSQTTVRILDLRGNLVTELENKFLKAGLYELHWNAKDYASGIYLLEIISGEKSDLRKVLLTK